MDNTHSFKFKIMEVGLGLRLLGNWAGEGRASGKQRTKKEWGTFSDSVSCVLLPHQGPERDKKEKKHKNCRLFGIGQDLDREEKIGRSRSNGGEGVKSRHHSQLF